MHHWQLLLTAGLQWQKWYVFRLMRPLDFDSSSARTVDGVQMTVQDAVPARGHCAGHGQCHVMSLPLGLQVAVRNAQQGVFYFTDQVGPGERVCERGCAIPRRH